MSDTFESSAGKIFIGGISPITTLETLRKYFGQFGELTDCVIMQDRGTGKFRGFGFVTYKDPSSISDVLAIVHVLDGKTVDCKRALPKDQVTETKKENYYKTKKMFVGGLPQSAREQEIKQYFEQFGRIEKATVMMDKQTGKSRGFGFVIFANEDSVERVMEHYQEHNIDGKWVECKKAVPRSKTTSSKDLASLMGDSNASSMELLTPSTLNTLMGNHNTSQDSHSSNENSPDFEQMHSHHQPQLMQVNPNVSEWNSFVNSSAPQTPELNRFMPQYPLQQIAPIQVQSNLMNFENHPIQHNIPQQIESPHPHFYPVPASPQLSNYSHQTAMMYRTPQPSPFSSPCVNLRAFTPKVQPRRICKLPVIGLSDTFASEENDNLNAVFRSFLKDKAETATKHRETLFTPF